MTVSTTHISNTHTGNGVLTVFNFTFQIQKPEDLQVKVASVIVTTGFTIALNSDQKQSPGGNVTFTVAPADGVAIEQKRVTSITQDVGFSNESLLNTSKLETIMDKLTLMLQEAKASAQGDTGPQGPIGPTGASGDITGPVSVTDGAIALWDGTGGNVLKEGPTPAAEGNILKIVGGIWTSAAAAATFPSGSIMLWDTNMAAIPTGWEAMDGRTVTINGVSKTTLDTRGKYLLCAAEADTGSSGYTGSTVRPGTVGGTKTHQHGQDGVVSVASSYVSGSISSNAVSVPSGGTVAFAAQNGSIAFSGGAHNHTASISGSVQANTEDQRPIQAALLLIVKVD